MLCIPTAINIMVIMPMVLDKAKESTFMRMAINIKEILKIIKSMELESLPIKIKGSIMVCFVII